MMFWVKVALALIDLIYLHEWMFKSALYFHLMFLNLKLKIMLLCIFFVKTINNRNHVSIVSYFSLNWLHFPQDEVAIQKRFKMFYPNELNRER